MDHHHQHVLIRAEPQQPRPQRDLRWPGRTARRTALATASARSASGDLGHRQLPAPAHRIRRTCWYGCPSDGGEDRAQHLVPADHVGQRRLQRRRVQVTRQPHRHRVVVGRRSVLPAGPGTTAAAGRTTAATRSGRGRAASASRAGPACSSRAASAAGVGASNSSRTGSLGAQHRAHPADQPHRQQRMPAQVEEVVVGPDRRQPEHVGEHGAQDLLPHRRRAAGPPSPPPRSRERAARRGPPSRSRSAAARRAPPPPTAPCTRAAALAANSRTASAPARRLHRRSAGGHHVGDQPPVAAGKRPPARSPPPAPTPGCAASTASTSPGSTRNPRIFTCSSARPRNTSRPPASHRARSPVRYSRAPSPANGSGDEPLRGQRRPPGIAPRHLRPADEQLPATPGGTGDRNSSSTYRRVFATGVPTGGVPLARSPGASRAVATPIVVSVGP